MNKEVNSLYSQIPAIDTLLREFEILTITDRYGQKLVVNALRALQAQARQIIAEQQQLPQWCASWPNALNDYLTSTQRGGLRQVFNLTGTVLHTNLGRALLSESAIEEVITAMRHAVTLEYDLGDGQRGHRDNTISALLCELTGAEAACIVNNNAAAVLLLLATIAPNKEVVVSRGELVEIGGAFRIPDVMQQAGCQLIEVGTTNRTHLRDYQNAINEQTGLLMKVHTSNYAIQGFTASVTEQELVQLGQKTGLPVAVDLGSGSLIDLQQYGLPAEPMPQTLIASGVNLVCFSGDKLLGGPQAGIIVGDKVWIDKIQRHPLKRALRAGKITLAALEATLRLYQQPDKLQQTLPTLRLLTRTTESIKTQANSVCTKLQPYYHAQFELQVEPCFSQIGSGSLPVDRLPSYAVTFTPKDGRGSTLEMLTEHWRTLNTPVIGYIREGKIWLDLRCLEQEQTLIEVLTT